MIVTSNWVDVVRPGMVQAYICDLKIAVRQATEYTDRLLLVDRIIGLRRAFINERKTVE